MGPNSNMGHFNPRLEARAVFRVCKNGTHVVVETYIVVSSSMKASLQSLQGKEKKFFVPFGREIYSENVEESLESNFHCIDNFNQKKTGIQL